MILVVDDDAELRDVIALALGHNGYRVRTAQDGREALDVVADEVPALVILDLCMPVMDGPEFMRHLRARTPNCPPVLLVTGSVEGTDEIAHIGAANVLTKPFPMQEIIRLVGNHLGTDR